MFIVLRNGNPLYVYVDKSQRWDGTDSYEITTGNDEYCDYILTVKSHEYWNFIIECNKKRTSDYDKFQIPGTDIFVHVGDRECPFMQSIILLDSMSNEPSSYILMGLPE